MNSASNNSGIFIRTFDLPDIHFASISGLEAPGKNFSGTRVCKLEEVDSIALNRWYEISKKEKRQELRKDCWLEIEGKIFMVWGMNIQARKYVNNTGIAQEKWEFSFSEMKRCKQSNN